ncbi:MmcQ/YjbR family DNA-binding protein [Flavobacterium aquiphilum]|uniref:MmcQ/YjbR family DNA-binding protein n=1 Tax=Flavobacterium aquiphilum TaxID=3003261 RepID=UPI0024817F44|nr:MmcQ/YjbR family DNA-binding protein [Flavobacterium aquiphilum]
MDIEKFRLFCLSLPDTDERMPFQGFFRNSRSILVFYVHSKMFCLLDIDNFESCTIKYHIDELEDLKNRYLAVGDPFNLSRKHWISVAFGKDLSDEKILKLVGDSYELVKKNLKKGK